MEKSLKETLIKLMVNDTTYIDGKNCDRMLDIYIASDHQAQQNIDKIFTQLVGFNFKSLVQIAAGTYSCLASKTDKKIV